MLGRFSNHIVTTATVVLALLCLNVSGCAYATASGRQQMAYARYVKKYSHNRVKQQTKFKKWKLPALPDSKRDINTSVGGGPQSVSAANGN
jgi:hypothetical protein